MGEEEGARSQEPGARRNAEAHPGTGGSPVTFITAHLTASRSRIAPRRQDAKNATELISFFLASWQLGAVFGFQHTSDLRITGASPLPQSTNSQPPTTNNDSPQTNTINKTSAATAARAVPDSGHVRRRSRPTPPVRTPHPRRP